MFLYNYVNIVYNITKYKLNKWGEKMLKKERFIVLFVSIIIIIVSIALLLNKKNIENILKSNQSLSKIYENNEKRKNEKIFDIKLKNNKLKKLLESLSFDKMDIAVSILQDGKLVDFLNNPDINSYIENIDYNRDLENAKVIRKLK